MARTSEVVRLSEALARVDEWTIKVVSRDDYLPAKQKANLARKLFRSLGLKGISVRLGRGTTAAMVKVDIPLMGCQTGLGAYNGCKCQGCEWLSSSRLKVEEILHRAFPRELDNSDSQADYYDPAWCFGWRYASED